jgi:hypothetical protein
MPATLGRAVEFPVPFQEAPKLASPCVAPVGRGGKHRDGRTDATAGLPTRRDRPPPRVRGSIPVRVRGSIPMSGGGRKIRWDNAGNTPWNSMGRTVEVGHDNLLNPLDSGSPLLGTKIAPHAHEQPR